MSKPRNVVVTGIPRCGTTLASALIDSLPDSVCLNEPAWQTAKIAASPADFAKWLVGDFMLARRKLLLGEPLPDRRAPSGEALTNYYAAKSGKMETTFELVPFTRAGLSEHFTLAIKHNGPYLAVLKQLIELDCFTIIAVIRHPLEVIASWRRLDLPISRGRMPGAAPYWPKLAKLAAQNMDLLEKQVRLYDLMCERIQAHQSQLALIRYEELVQNPQLISRALGVKAQPALGLVDKPQREISLQEKETIAAALARHGEHWRRFYD